MPELVEIRAGGLSALINPLGAELTSLTDADGGELMTDADPAFWAGHAPVLFPIVGRLNGDVLRLDEREFPMKQHGFARRMMFEVVEHEGATARFRLTADDETRAVYPFEFALDVAFAVRGATLAIDATVTNCGAMPMSASLGFHPAFAWPLPYGRPRGGHLITFDADEPGDIVELDGGLFAAKRPSPLDGRTLQLTDDLFADDALIWDPVHSSGVTYGAGHGPRLRVDFPDTPYLGIWTKPGAAFVCIEPWHGHADPVGFTGDFRDKPGVFIVAPGSAWRCSMRVTLLP
ncbi:MAG: aldose 1-epimerase family protein [Proteobacteria bacterium]|nr:aldose 1-epimerase family protein [Pseudomonadota bacterium]